MKRSFAFFMLCFVLVSFVSAVTEAPISDIDLDQRPSQEMDRDPQWYSYAVVSEMTNLNWPTPERGTIFQMTTDFGLAYPVTISSIGHYFYEHSSYPWPDDTFYFRIYDSDGTTILYQTLGIEAERYPTETIHELRTPLVVNDDFIVAIVPADASGHPSSLSTNRGTGATIHTVVGEAGNWAYYDTGTAAYELITRIYADAPEAATGNIQGNVYAYGSTTPLENATMSIGTQETLTNAQGYYEFNDIYVGDYGVACYAPDGSAYFSEGTIVTVTEDQTTVQNFYLKWAEIETNPTYVNETLAVDQTSSQSIRITNDGPGDLEYHAYLNFMQPVREFNQNAWSSSMRMNTNTRNDSSPTVSANPTISRELGDVVFDLDAQTPTSETQLLGVEYVNGYFWATGAGSDSDPNYVYKLDRQGNLIASYEQDATSTGWGYRDLAYDGTYLYTGNETSFVRIDPATGAQTVLFTFTAAEFGNVTCIRALAYVPGYGFYTKSFASDIVRFNADGTVLEVIPSPGISSTYGMAYDDVNGKLWFYEQSGTPETTFYQYDHVTQALTGLTYTAPLVGDCVDQMAGGCSFSSDLIYGKLVLVGMVQGTPNDYIFALEIEATETWVTINSNSSGTISGSARDYLDLSLGFDSADLMAGTTKTAELVIVHNADYEGNVTVPITLQVSGGQLDTPLNIVIEEIDGDMHINWGAVTGASQYNVYRSTLPDSGFSPYDTTTNNSYIDSAPGANKYFYRVTAE